MEQNIDRKALIRAAFAAREYAYTPYSNFKVGAALLAKNGSVYTGCNIECATFTPTNCAERTALFKAVSEGVHEFAAVARGGRKKTGAPDDALITSPCGVCRQMLYEFGGPDLRVIMAEKRKRLAGNDFGRIAAFGLWPGKGAVTFFDKKRPFCSAPVRRTGPVARPRAFKSMLRPF